MRRVLVIGGRGFYGSAVVKVLNRIGDLELTVASRAGPVTVDLNRPETFGKMDDFDLVVNCSDTVNAPPDEAIRHCVSTGGTFLEMGADAPTSRRLMDLKFDAPKGLALIGVGIFPGVSTALAKSVTDADCSSLELGIRLSPFSGAGSGNCALMSEYMRVPSFAYREGAIVEGPPVGAPAAFDFLGSGKGAGPLLAMPDTELIHRSTQVPNVATYLALKPGFLRYNFKVASVMAGLIPPLLPLFVKLTEWSLMALRAVVLRGVTSTVQLTAVAKGDDRIRVRQASFSDGQLATALGVGAVASLWPWTSPPEAGILTVADLFTFDELIIAMTELADGQCDIAYSEG